MKKTTCKDLRGACDAVITGNSAEEMAENSKKHVMKMVQTGDKAHLKAMEDMKSLSKESQIKWYNNFVANFDSLPEA